jgi:hypothetical protein
MSLVGKGYQRGTASDLRFALPAKKLALLGIPLVSELPKKAQTLTRSFRSLRHLRLVLGR